MELEVSRLVSQKTPELELSSSQLNRLHVFSSSSLVNCFSVGLPFAFRTSEVVFLFQISLAHSCQTA